MGEVMTAIPVQYPMNSHFHSASRWLLPFVANFSPVRQFLYSLARSKQHKNILLCGPKGVGKRAIAFSCWQAMELPDRPFDVCHGSLLSSKVFAKRAVSQVAGGDLYVPEADQIPERVLTSLGIFAKSADVRLIGSLSADASIPSETRLCVEAVFAIKVDIPSIRERPGDIASMVRSGLQSVSAMSISDKALKLLSDHSWNGEMDQLVYCTLRAARLARQERCLSVQSRHILGFLDDGPLEWMSFWVYESLQASPLIELSYEVGLRKATRMVEALMLAQALDRTEESLSKTARSMQLPVNTLNNRKTVLRQILGVMSRYFKTQPLPLL